MTSGKPEETQRLGTRIAPIPVQGSGLYWLPVLCVLAAITAESTRTAGAATTLRLLLLAINRLHVGIWFTDVVLTNQELRKLGHVAGYGLLALLTARAWVHRAGSRCRWLAVAAQAAGLGVGCAATVAILDEWHQSFLPGRTSSMEDVMIDSLSGAVFVLLYVAVESWNRRQHRAQAGAVS